MFEVSMFTVDKFVHRFIQNLGLRIEPSICKNFKQIAFITYVDRACKIKQQLFYSAEKINETNIQQNWDFSNERNIRYFIEKHASFFDKLISLSNTRILTSHLKNINTKILQKVRKRKKNNETMKTVETKMVKKRNLLSPASHKDKYINFYKYKRNKFRKTAVFENRKIHYHDATIFSSNKDINILKTKNGNQKTFVRHTLPNNVMNIARKEIEIAEKFLWLYTKDIEYIKRNVQVILYIAKKSTYNIDIRDQIKYNQMLCRHAILCLIEPSKKAFVLFEDNLSVVIQKYLLHGYKYNFEFQRDSEDYYIALLVLNQWAKVLVKHMNTTMIRTICGILGCDVQKILVLYCPEEKLL